MSAAEGFGADRTPWGAVLRAALEALSRSLTKPSLDVQPSPRTFGPAVPDQGTIVLYVLSTPAQTREALPTVSPCRIRKITVGRPRCSCSWSDFSGPGAPVVAAARSPEDPRVRRVRKVVDDDTARDGADDHREVTASVDARESGRGERAVPRLADGRRRKVDSIQLPAEIVQDV